MASLSSFPFQATLAGRTLAVFLLAAFFALARPNGHHVNAQISLSSAVRNRQTVRGTKLTLKRLFAEIRQRKS